MSDPFSAKEEKRLEWYFEEHLRFPFTNQIMAEAAAASIVPYGTALFDQVFADRRAYSAYAAARSQGVETITFEIAGNPSFHHLHWEALRDPDLDQPLALQAPFVRRNLQPQPIQARLRESTTINLLVVTARPARRQGRGLPHDLAAAGAHAAHRRPARQGGDSAPRHL